MTSLWAFKRNCKDFKRNCQDFKRNWKDFKRNCTDSKYICIWFRIHLYWFRIDLYWFRINLYWGCEPWIWELVQANLSKIQKVKTSMTFDQDTFWNIGCFNFFWWQKVKTSSSLLIKILIQILDVLTFSGSDENWSTQQRLDQDILCNSEMF